MSRMLVVVDMQNDFIDGALGTKEAQDIVAKVVDKMKAYEAAGREMVFTMDTHDDNYTDTQEGRKLPVAHCIKGTKGWDICDEVKSAVDFTQYKKYEKSSFGSDRFAMDLAHGAYKDVTEMEFVGLCTDICVISNAMLAKTFLPEANIIVDAGCCAGVTPKSHEQALGAMKMCHVDII